MENTSQEALAQQAAEYSVSSIASIEPHTAEEYFTILLGRAVYATKSGDYGISAALVIRYDDVELISFGQNTMISNHDPFGHAEANAIRSLRGFMALDASDRIKAAVQWINPESVVTSKNGTGIFIRSVPPSHTPESILYTTLEPCPMCTVAIMNSRIQRVIIAIPDEPGGVLAPERLARLPGIWPRLAASQGLQVAFANSHSPEDTNTYISPELSAMLNSIFWDTKAERDAEVFKGVLFGADLETSMKNILKAHLKA